MNYNVVLRRIGIWAIHLMLWITLDFLNFITTKNIFIMKIMARKIRVFKFFLGTNFTKYENNC